MSRSGGHPTVRVWSAPHRQLSVLLGLTGFAISQPLLGVLGDEPTVLARYGIRGWELAALGATVALVPPLVLWSVTWAVGAGSPRLGRLAHLLAVGMLVAFATIQVAKSSGVERGPALAVLGAGAAAAFLVAYVRHLLVATWASYTAFLPFLAVGAFVVTSPASALRSSLDAPERVAGAEHLPSVVLILLDELPTRSVLDAQGHLDGVRFPNLAGFAQDATWYRHHSAIATLTEGAVPSMLTGRLPVAERAVWTNHPDNLFTLLAPTHELEVLEQSTELCPYDVCAPSAGGDDEASGAPETGGPGFSDALALARDVWFERVSLGEQGAAAFDDFAEVIGPGTDAPAPLETSPSVTVHPGRREGDDPAQELTPSRATAMIESFDPAKGPALYYLHLMLPHQPFTRYPDGTEYLVVDPLGYGLPKEDKEHLFSWSAGASAVSEQQHLLQAQYADRILGQVLQGLRRSSLYEDSLVIVASDHGISFEADTASRYAESSTLDALAYAPLLVKAPGQTEGSVDDSNVMFLDLLPTIAQELDIDIPWRIDGAAIGSPGIDARGSRKVLYDMMGFGGFRIRDVYPFDDREVFPQVADRAIGPLTEPDDPLSGLHAHLGVDGLVGRALDDVVSGSSGSVVVDDLGALRHPGEPPPIGVVTGRLAGAADGGLVVVAVDGTIVGGGLLGTDAAGRSGRFSVLLPQGALDGDNSIRVGLVEDRGRVVELEVRS